MFRFSKHYTIEEARQLLPELRGRLERLAEMRRTLEPLDDRLGTMLKEGCDTGGEMVNQWVRCLAEAKGIVLEFKEREIQIKDIERGLIDFPSLRQGREVFLCWEKDETDIEFWHDLDSGYGGRERLE